MIKFTYINPDQTEKIEFVLERDSSWMDITDACHRFIKAMGDYPPGVDSGAELNFQREDDVILTRDEYSARQEELEALEDRIDHLEEREHKLQELEKLLESGQSTEYRIVISDMEPEEIVND